MKLRNILLALIISLLFVFTSCEIEVKKSEKTTFTDMIGRRVEVDKNNVKRVVCIGAGALRMYSYVCPLEYLVGVEDIDNLSLNQRPKMFDGVSRPYVQAYSNIFQTLPSCGVGGPQMQVAESEKILMCNPDIVISEYEDVTKEDALQVQLGVPVITLKSGSKGVFDEQFFSSLTLLGEIFNCSDKANALISFIKTEEQDIRQRTSNITDKPKAYVCGLGNWGTTNHLMTSVNYAPFEVANIQNALSDLSFQGIGKIEEETFISLGSEIEIMFIDAAAVKNIKPLYNEDPTMFDDILAWQTGEVYLEMAYNAYYTNYEISLMNTWFMAKTAYPDHFSDIDITLKTNEITQAFYGMDLASEIFSISQNFGGYQKINTETFFK